MEQKGFEREAMRITVDYNNMMRETLGARGLTVEELKALPELNRDTVKAAFKKVQKANKLKGQQVYMPIRVTLTGNQHGPELAEMIPLFGLERTEKRILKSLEKAGVSL